MRIAVGIGCVSAVVALVAGCGADQQKAEPEGSVSSTAGPSATPSPTPSWAASPGQSAKVVAALTAKKYECSAMTGTAATFNVCAKTPVGEPSKYTTWFKFVSAPDGTVVHVVTSGTKENRDGLIAVLGAKDTNILLAFGKNLSWGTTDGRSVTLKGVTDPFVPPRPEGFETSKEDLLAIYQPDQKMDCRLADPTATPTAPEFTQTPETPADTDSPSLTPTPAETPEPESSLSCSLKHAFEEPEVNLNATARGTKLIGLELFASAKADGPIDPHIGQTYLPVAKVFANAKAALLSQSTKLWPALKGADVADLKTWIDARVKLNQNSLGYVGNHRVEVLSYQNGTYGLYQIRITVSAEESDLSEPQR